jgi:aldehyde dehydrogenase (NAD+)
MTEYLQFYINGEWVDPIEPKTLDVINPATEDVVGRISLGSAADVDKAVAAAKAAFESYSRTTKEERVALLERVLGVYATHVEELAQTVSQEMGAPMWLANLAQVPSGMAHLATMIEVLKGYEFSETRGNTRIVKEPAGVCGLITPWNWPLNQIMCKVAPALAAGCTMVLKPSEIAPMNAILVAKILDEAGVPAGVFNLVNGDGVGVGAPLSAHPDIEMVSFTGSTRAGILVAKAGAETVKRVHQELGGKSPNIILDDADLDKAVDGGVKNCFSNSGQSCNAPTRMFVPAAKHARALEIAAKAASEIVAGAPDADGTTIGPVVSKVQWDKIQGLINKGIEEGAQLVAGGPGLPDGLTKGYFVKPTVFGGVTNEMTISKEEVFGPVLAILPYDTEEDAIRMANDTVYGLCGYVSGEPAHALEVASRLRAGGVHLNGAGPDFSAPFGGYKQSGNGREWGPFGFEDFLEIKAVMGAGS